jgi:hypothetical protein
MAAFATTDRPESQAQASERLQSIGLFYRGEPTGRTWVVRFWNPEAQDYAARWLVGRFDAADRAGAFAVVKHHFPDAENVELLDGDFELMPGNGLRRIGKDRR